MLHSYLKSIISFNSMGFLMSRFKNSLFSSDDVELAILWILEASHILDSACS